MMSVSTAHVDKPFHLPSSFKFLTRKIDQGIDVANIRGVVSLTFFIMT